MEKIEIEVIQISNSRIKPSLPLPSSHPKTFPISLLDQIFPIIHTPILLFYTPPPSKSLDPTIVTTLKTSLSHTLNTFYPFAGQFLNSYTISCENFQGIPFIETKVNLPLSTLLTSPYKLNLLTHLLPPQELRAFGPRPVSELVPLAFQINIFSCGGVVLGCYILHKLLDASSFITFLQHWAALASNRPEDLARPDFESKVKAFPPIPELEDNKKVTFVLQPTKDKQTMNSNRVIAKSFRFSSTALKELKAMASSEKVPNPTRFETILGFILQMGHPSSSKTGGQDQKTTLNITVNMRSRMNPPLPKESMGNCVLAVGVQFNDLSNNNNLGKLVEEIHSTISDVNKRIKEDYQSENRGQIYLEKWTKDLEKLEEDEDGRIYRATSWCKLGLDKVDFGFGKLNRVVPGNALQPPAALRNFIFLSDYFDGNDGDGVEVWVFLEENEMKELESNPDFLAFACPSW